MTATTTITDIDALKDRLKATWMDGNYDYFSRFMESSAALFLDRLGVAAGASLLDVACWLGPARPHRRAPGHPGHRSRHRHGLDPGRARPSGFRGARRAFRRGRRGGAALRGCKLRRGRQHLRGDVRSAPRTGGGRAAARLPSRRDDRHGQLDQGRVHRPDVQDLRPLHSTSGHALPRPLGRRERRARATGRGRVHLPADPGQLPVRLSLSAGRGGRVLPGELRADDPRVCRARRRRSGRTARGPRRSAGPRTTAPANPPARPSTRSISRSWAVVGEPVAKAFYFPLPNP